MRRAAAALLCLALTQGASEGLGDDGLGGGRWLGGVFCKIFDSAHYGKMRVGESEGNIVSSYADRLDPERVLFSREELDVIGGKWKGKIRDDIEGGHFVLAQEMRMLSADRLEELCARAREAGGPEDGERAAVFRRAKPRVLRETDLAQAQTRYLSFENLRRGTRGGLRNELEAEALRRRKMSDEDVRNIFLDAVAEAFDHHSGYYPPGEHRRFLGRITLKKSGVGIELDPDDVAGGGVGVVGVSKGGAAEAGGQIFEGDTILALSTGGEGAMTPVEELEPGKIRDILESGAGETVTFKIAPKDGAGETREVPVKSGSLPVKAEEMVAGTVMSRDNKKIGVIRIPSFYEGEAGRRTEFDAGKTLNTVLGAGAEAVILDFRGDRGGSIGEAVSLTGMFLEGCVVRTVDRNGAIHDYRTRGGGVVYKGPLVALVNSGTASAAEIVAKAIQDHRRGVVVGGERTLGKGSMQHLVDLDRHGGWKFLGEGKAGAVKITTRLFFGPGGEGIQGRGVVPDVSMPCPYDTARRLAEADGLGERTLEPRAIAGDIGLGGEGEVSPETVDRLKKRSADRQRENPAFSGLRALDVRFKELAKENSVPLEQNGFLEKMTIFGELQAALSSYGPIRGRGAGGTPNDKGPDVALEEALSIAADLAGGIGEDTGSGQARTKTRRE